MPRLAAITYDGLPISSGGAHKLRTRGFTAGLDALQSFVNTMSLEPTPFNLAVEVLEGEGVPKVFCSELLSDFDARFARRPGRQIGDYIGRQWTIDPICLTRLARQLEKRRPIPRAGYAGHAAFIHVTWNLVFADPRTGGPLSHQSKDEHLGFDIDYQRCLGQSFLYSTISETTTAHLFLSLPFDEITEEARELAKKIQATFPARLSAKHWKIWTLTKKGNSYVGRKIPSLV